MGLPKGQIKDGHMGKNYKVLGKNLENFGKDYLFGRMFGSLKLFFSFFMAKAHAFYNKFL